MTPAGASSVTPEPTASRRGKPRLLAVGYWVPATGFHRVLQSVFTPLAGDYDIHVIGIAYKGPVLRGDFTIYPCNLRGGDVFGVFQARDFVESFRPELVFLLNDIWILNQYLPVLAPHQARTRIICYCPIDGGLVAGSLIAPFAGLVATSRFVVYTEFARQEIRRAASAYGDWDARHPFRDPVVIPHGVDTDTFHPLAGSIERQLAPAGRLAAKRRLAPGEPDLHDSFFVLNANRAQPRKRLDLTLQGFALFAREKPANVKLVLHQAVAYGDERAEIWRQAEQLGIADRVIMSPAGETAPADGELNLIYNACDVGVNTAMGEGWGLVSFEHAATGAAQIVPRHTAFTELWTAAAEMLEPGAGYVPRFALLEMQAVAPEGVAAALERLYSRPQYREALSLAAYRNATQPRYRWEHIAGLWRRLFEEAINQDNDVRGYIRATRT